MLVAEKVSINTGRIVLQQGALPNAFTYTGRHWDPVARLYHYRARAYDPDTGSFLQHDPIPSANPYAYTDNDPVNFTDPLGLKKREVKCWTFTRVSNRQYCVHDVCYPCGAKCQVHMRKACESAGRSYRSTQAPSGVCTNCQPLDRVESCEKLCSKDVYPATCLKQCKDHLPPPAQDNPNGDGKNDDAPIDDVSNDDVGAEPNDSSPKDGPNRCRKKDFEKDPYVDYHCGGNRKLQECVHECMRRGNDNDIWRVVSAIDAFSEDIKNKATVPSVFATDNWHLFSTYSLKKQRDACVDWCLRHPDKPKGPDAVSDFCDENK